MIKLLAAFAVGAAVAVAAPSTGPAPLSIDWQPTEFVACQSEDGSTGQLPCYWDADQRGNGTGASYVIHLDRSVTYTN